MRIRAALFVLLLTFCRPSGIRAQASPEPRTISIVVGKGELLEFGHDIGRVVIAEPKIADAVPVSPRHVMVNAKGVGHTSLVVWETDTAAQRYEITVLADTTETDALHKSLTAQLASTLPGSAIQLSGNADMLLLTGKVNSAEESKRAEAIAGTYAKKVNNLLQMPDPRQIMLQVKFASVDRTALNQFGMNLLSRNPAMIGASSTQQFAEPLFSQLQFQNHEFAGSNINLSNLLNLFLFRPDLNIGATIQALQQQNLLQILAEPNLIVVEGSEASFLAGGEFPFPSITSTPTGGGIAPVVTVQFRKFGVQLNFTPVITPSGAIMLKVKPEVSALDFNNAVTLQGFLIPAISSRVAETEVVLKDGESFAIAGLIDNRVTQVMSRIRGIGDLPILGRFFRSRTTNKTTDELLVVVTPRFVKPLAPGEQAELPQTMLPFLPPLPKAEVGATAAKGKKPKKGSSGSTQVAAPSGDKANFVGPRGHEAPQQ